MYYEFREVRQREMDACFELRASCYRTTMSTDFVECAEFRKHDNQARHFGLFRRDSSEQRVVGYVRVAEAFPESPSLPSLHYFGTRNLSSAKRMLGKLLDKHGMVVEAGRLSMPRSAGQALLAKHVVDCLIALYGLGLEAPALLSCAEKHRRFYEVFGFRQILADEEIAFPWKRALTSICMLRLPGANGLVKTRHFMMLDAYRQYGAIAYKLEDSGNFTPLLLDAEGLDGSTRLLPTAAA